MREIEPDIQYVLYRIILWRYVTIAF